MMKPGRINLVMDGQWGSTGKGKIAGYLALRDKPHASVCDFMTNAGHWFRSRRQGDFLVQQLPAAAVNWGTKLYIAAGAAITVPVLMKEIEQFEKADIPIVDRLHIDSCAIIIEKRHGEEEALELGYISSTLKGCGAALAAKVLRRRDVVLARDVPELAQWCTGPIAPMIWKHLDAGETVMGELAQGFDLSLNHGHQYPYVTSRDITPAAFLSNCGIPPRYLGDVYGVIRTFPIRVGNVKDSTGTTIGWSGPHYIDQTELTWDQVSALSSKNIVPEKTTVTQKVRRVFTFSIEQYKKFVSYCAPTKIALNFCNYFPGIDENSTMEDVKANPGLTALMSEILAHYIPIVMFGTGADNEAIIDIEAR